MKTLVGDAREIKSLGYPSVRENWCRPYGTRTFVPLSPGTSVPGFHMPPLRGWSFGGACSTASLQR